MATQAALSALEEIFYNPKTGYINVQALYEKSKEANLPLKYLDVKQWYNSQSINQIYKRPVKVKTYNKIISHYNQPGELQGDLMIMDKFPHQNSGYKYIFNVIDIYSRYAWSFPLESDVFSSRQSGKS